jgi:flagellar biosynthesis/type III secretory pathway protein FliH
MTLSYRRIPQAKIDWDPYPVTADLAITDSGVPGASAEGQQDAMAQKMEQAYNAGYEAARSECLKEMESRVGQEVRAFISMVDDLVSQRQRLINDSEEAVVRLSCQIARRIIEKSVEINEEAIIDVVKNALRHLVDKQKLIIRVNPEDLEVINRYQSEWMTAAGASTNVKVNEDTRVKRGGCLIEGESGNVEAQIDRQIEVIERALVEAVR